MAAITSAQAGDWSNTATWTGGTIPGNGDTVTISHAVTLSDSRTIGTSPAAGNVVCLVVSAGTLTIQSGAVLRLRGDLEARGVIALQGGGELKFDATAASSPSTTSYNARVSSTSSAGNGRIVTSGTSSASRAKVSSDTTGGAANGRLNADSGRGYYDLDYVDFTDVGTAGSPALSGAVTSTATVFRVLHCSFTRCGCVTLSQLATNCICRMEDLTFRNGLDTGSLDMGATSAIGTGTRTLSRVTTDQPVMRTGSAVGLRDFTVSYIIAPKGCGFSTSSNTAPVTLANSYFRLASDFGSANLVLPALTSQDCYVFFQNTGTSINPHPVMFAAQTDVAAQTARRLIIEVGDTVTTSDGDMFNAPSPSSATTIVIENCLTLPKGGDPTKHAGQFFSLLGNANVTVKMRHNTYVCGGLAGESGAPSYGETYTGRSGLVAEHYSNLAYGLAAGYGQIFTRRNSGAVSDGVLAANCDYNGVFRPVTSTQANGTYAGVPGYYDWATAPPATPMFSSTAGLGAHDVSGDPGMVDPTRNIATWAVSRGSVSGTYAGRAADAEAYLMADPTLVDSLNAHVFGGWTPTNPAFRNAGQDGVTIGPVEGIFATGFSFTGPSSGKIGAASTNFTVTPNANYNGTITPDDGGAGGTFTPSSLSWSGDAAAKTFTYTPSTAGARTISVSNSWGLANPSSIAYTATASTYTLTGPASGTVGLDSSNFTVTPNGPYTGTITPNDGGAGGTFTPSSLSWTADSSAKTFVYNAASAGDKTIGATNNGGLTNPASLTYTASTSGGGISSGTRPLPLGGQLVGFGTGAMGSVY